MSGEHRAAYHCENGDVAARFFAFVESMPLKQICSCSHIPACVTLASGEGVIVAYLSFMKSS